MRSIKTRHLFRDIRDSDPTINYSKINLKRALRKLRQVIADITPVDTAYIYSPFIPINCWATGGGGGGGGSTYSGGDGGDGGSSYTSGGGGGGGINGEVIYDTDMHEFQIYSAASNEFKGIVGLEIDPPPKPTPPPNEYIRG